jgi:hypothetical protein
MRRTIIFVLSILVAAGLTATAALAATTINPANAPGGTHFAGKTSAPVCTVTSSLAVTCTGYELAGVGNANATASLSVTFSGTVDCSNSGTNPNNAIESHETTFTTVASTGSLSPKNGRLAVPSLSSAAPPSQPSQTLCPNPNWTATWHAGSPVLQSFTYTLTFVGFPGAFITVTGP